MMSSAFAIQALWKREIIKFTRDRSRLLGALAQPLGFWLLLGLGFDRSFINPVENGSNVNYLEFLFPGIITLIILFTAIFSTISIVEDRKSGFLQAALVAPSPRFTIVLGNTLGGTSLALLEAMLFLFLLPLIGITPSFTGLLLIVLTSTLIGLSFTALGFIIAWHMNSTRGFHAVMNLFLLPLWLLSGAPFPVEGASFLLRWIMQVNPVTYGVNALRQALYWPVPPEGSIASLPLSILITALFTVIIFLLALRSARRPLLGSGKN